VQPILFHSTFLLTLILPNITSTSSSSGTMADLPFQLTGGENEEPFTWKTSGEPRRLEEDLGSFPVLSDCGQGLVYSFAGAVDGGKATERFLRRTVDQEAADTERRIYSNSPRQNGSTVRELRGGVFTTAFKKSVLATGGGSIEKGLRELRNDVQQNNAEWEAEIRRGDKQAGTNNWESHEKFCQQEPSFGSSHFCRLDRPLFL
jgi:hypothetical protein